jgi:hypothetical protein
MIVKTMMSPSPVSLFHLRQLLALLVSELGSHLAVRVAYDLVNPTSRVSPNITELCSCFIDDWRNLGDLLRSQIEFSS